MFVMLQDTLLFTIVVMGMVMKSPRKWRNCCLTQEQILTLETDLVILPFKKFLLFCSMTSLPFFLTKVQIHTSKTMMVVPQLVAHISIPNLWICFEASTPKTLRHHVSRIQKQARTNVGIVMKRRKIGRSALDASTFGIAIENVNSSIGTNTNVIAR